MPLRANQQHEAIARSLTIGSITNATALAEQFSLGKQRLRLCNTFSRGCNQKADFLQ